MQIPQHLATLEFPAAEMEVDDRARESARVAQDIGIVEVARSNRLQDFAPEHERALFPTDTHRTLLDALFVTAIPIDGGGAVRLVIEIQRIP